MTMLERRDALLLIEDEPRLLELVRDALAQSSIDAEIVEVKDGLAAIDILHGKGVFANKDSSYLPKLILLNLTLPKFSGTNVLHVLQAEARTWDIPIVIVSGTEQEVKDLELGNFHADAYVLEREVTSVKRMVEVLEENWPRDEKKA